MPVSIPDPTVYTFVFLKLQFAENLKTNFYSVYSLRIALAVLFSAAGFLLVGFANAEWMALLGVIITSASSGIGETTFLAYSSHFNK